MGYTEIESRHLSDLLAEGEGRIVLIDVRSPQEVTNGTIHGSKHIPLHMIPLKEQDLVKGDDRIVFYCRSGARSAQACLYLAQRGRRNLYNLRGGISAWVQAGLPAHPPA